MNISYERDNKGMKLNQENGNHTAVFHINLRNRLKKHISYFHLCFLKINCWKKEKFHPTFFLFLFFICPRVLSSVKFNTHKTSPTD